MRPLIRPEFEDSQPTNYKKYLRPLIDAFGQYCSYCERIDKLDVEHVEPQSANAALSLEWSNCLLGCPRCNRDFKRSNNRSRQGFCWPDEQDTFKILRYFSDGRVKPQINLTPEQLVAVEATIHLTRLDDGKEPQIVLNLARRMKFKAARRAKKHFEDGIESVDDVLQQASEGFWSVWMTVFADVPEVKRALCNSNSYPNTRDIS